GSPGIAPVTHHTYPGSGSGSFVIARLLCDLMRSRLIQPQEERKQKKIGDSCTRVPALLSVSASRGEDLADGYPVDPRGCRTSVRFRRCRFAGEFAGCPTT